MSWKKSVFSNLMWGTYTLITGLVVVELSVAAVKLFRGPSYMGPILALALVALVAGCVFLLHRLSAGRENTVQSGARKLLVGEAVFVIVILVLGLVLRMDGIAGVGDGGGYYEAAIVAEGHSIPELVHGAVYLYLQLLHIIFVLVGNKLAAGIWFQVILQLLAVLLLYIGVRKLAGVLPAMIMVVFYMCSEPAVQGALTLSPEPLYLLLFSIGLNMLAACSGELMAPVLFLPVGIWIGLTGYLDISGFLLLFFSVAVVLAVREQEIFAKTRIAAFVICMGGVLAGFAGAILADAYISGKKFVSVLNAWLALYRPRDYGFDVVGLSDGLFWEGPLFLLMCFGVFSYWCSRERERISMWMLMVCMAAAAQYFGVLTEELPSAMYLLLGMTVLAGVGIRASYREKAEAVVPGDAMETEEQMETQEARAEARVETQAKKQVVKQIEKDIGQPVEQQVEYQVEQQEEYQADEQVVQQLEEQAEENDMATTEIDGMKLPKYLREPGSDRVKIPKYMQEEAAQSKPKPPAKPEEPVKAEPEVAVEPAVEEEKTAVQESQEETLRAEEPGTAVESATDKTETVADIVEPVQEVQEAAVRPEQGEEEADPQAMYGVPEKFRNQGAQKPQETAGQPLPEQEIKDLSPKQGESEAPSKPSYIENPLPLPKPHQKKVLDYHVESSGYDDDFDHPVDENDDFDIQ